jgi:hypothetical protein
MVLELPALCPLDPRHCINPSDRGSFPVAEGGFPTYDEDDESFFPCFDRPGLLCVIPEAKALRKLSSSGFGGKYSPRTSKKITDMASRLLCPRQRALDQQKDDWTALLFEEECDEDDASPLLSSFDTRVRKRGWTP